MISSGTILKSVNRNIQADVLATETNQSEIENMEYDGLENLAGYICHKLKNENPDLVSNSSTERNYSWVNHLSEGGLSKPSTSLMNTLILCDSIFSKLNGDKLLLASGYLQKHLLEAKEIEASDDVKKLFFRCRMYFRIRKLNSEIVESTYKRKRKYSKITN